METILETIEEIARRPSPAPRPQSLAFDGELLWMGSLETQRLYAIDPRTWAVREEAQASGRPIGMVAVGDELRVVCSETEEDHRVIRKFVPGHGFRKEGAIPCPDDTGSFLGYDGDLLYVSQFYNRKIISLDDAGHPGAPISAPHDICGLVIVEGYFYLITTEDEESDEYFLTRIDARDGKVSSEDIARVPFRARALAYDGRRFWTNHREQNEIVAFTASIPQH
jgi:hypothetical protein